MRLSLKSLHSIVALLCLGCAAARGAVDEKPMRAGMIGLDTSHVPAFVKIFNQAQPGSELAGIKVVAGYPGGTDFAPSRTRVAKFTQEIRAMGVEIVDSIPALLEKVDVVLLESVDGRIHLEEATPVIKAGKRLFIDKPLAGSLADAIAILDLAKKHGVPCFSSSSFRFSPAVRKLRANTDSGRIAGVATWGACHPQAGTPDMFFYGMHGIEALFTLMGPGCLTVARVHTPDTDHLTGVWNDGRVGTYRGIRNNNTTFGATVFGSTAIVQAERGDGYDDLCREVVRFFKSGRSHVSPEETIEIFAFMEAADESKRRGGAPVALSEVLDKARAIAASRK